MKKIYTYRIVREQIGSNDLALVRELVDDELTHTYGIVGTDGDVEFVVPAEVMALLDPYGIKREDVLDGGGSLTDYEEKALQECDNVLLAIYSLIKDHERAAYQLGETVGREATRQEVHDVLGVGKVVNALEKVADELTSLSNIAGRNAQ